MSRFCIESLKSDNSIGNINRVESLKENKSNFQADKKGFHPLGQVVVWIIYITVLLMHLLLPFFGCFNNSKLKTYVQIIVEY